MKYVKVGHHVQVLSGDRYFHAQVTEVTDQDAIEIDLDGVPTPATRVVGEGWLANRFEV
jgi:preprotein translocase subunit YajC